MKRVLLSFLLLAWAQLYAQVNGGWEVQPREMPYPPLLRQAGVGGPVKLEVYPSDNGSKQRVVVSGKPNRELKQAAMENVRTWGFQKVGEGEKPLSITYLFVLTTEVSQKPKSAFRYNPDAGVATITSGRQLKEGWDTSEHLVYPPDALLLMTEGTVELTAKRTKGRFVAKVESGHKLLAPAAVTHLTEVLKCVDMTESENVVATYTFRLPKAALVKKDRPLAGFLRLFKSEQTLKPNPTTVYKLNFLWGGGHAEVTVEVTTT